MKRAIIFTSIALSAAHAQQSVPAPTRDGNSALVRLSQEDAGALARVRALAKERDAKKAEAEKRKAGGHPTNTVPPDQVRRRPDSSRAQRQLYGTTQTFPGLQTAAPGTLGSEARGTPGRELTTDELSAVRRVLDRGLIPAEQLHKLVAEIRYGPEGAEYRETLRREAADAKRRYDETMAEVAERQRQARAPRWANLPAGERARLEREERESAARVAESNARTAATIGAEKRASDLAEYLKRRREIEDKHNDAMAALETQRVPRKPQQPPTWTPRAGSREELFFVLLSCIRSGGLKIIGKDGVFLGDVSTDKVSPNSVSNTIGKYGSEIAQDSVFNTIGRYGSSISGTSATNTIAQDPPALHYKGKFVAHLSANQVKVPRISLTLLKAALELLEE